MDRLDKILDSRPVIFFLRNTAAIGVIGFLPVFVIALWIRQNWAGFLIFGWVVGVLSIYGFLNLFRAAAGLRYRELWRSNWVDITIGIGWLGFFATLILCFVSPKLLPYAGVMIFPMIAILLLADPIGGSIAHVLRKRRPKVGRYQEPFDKI